MEIIAHRRNTLAELRDTPTEHGVEIDVRTFGGELVLNHEPFEPGVALDTWLARYAHGTLIVNVKEDGLERRILDSLAARGITRFFFLDQPFPSLVKMAREGERRCAVRVSEYEAPTSALALASSVDWVWIDCFTRFPLDRAQLDELRAAGLSLCIVSPELQGRSRTRDLREFVAEFRRLRVVPDAVCTKRGDLWAAAFQ